MLKQYKRPTHVGLAGRVFRLLLQTLLPVAILAAAFGGYRYMKATKPEVKKRAPREATFVVRSVPVAFGTVVPELTLYGTTIAGRQVELRSLVAGRVIETGSGLRDGAVVEKGDTLLRIDPFDFKVKLDESRAQAAEAAAKLAEMKASLATEKDSLAFIQRQLRLARTDLERARPLARRGAVTDRTVDERELIVVQREQAAKQSQNTIAVWAARIEQQTAVVLRLQSTVAQAERRLQETTLSAPFNAYVSGIGAQVGRMVGANDSVATLIDRDWIEARFTLTNEQYGRLVNANGGLSGRKLVVNWQAGDRVFAYPAWIERVAAQVTASSGGVTVYARLDAPSKPVPIRPGVFVEVKMNDARFENVARLPSSAVYDGRLVYVIAKGRLQARKIRIATTSGDDVLVQGDLKSGERVAVTRLSAPGDGVRVEDAKATGGGNGA